MAMHNNSFYEIARTGKLQQQYTLYVHREIFGDGFAIFNRNYIQNIGSTEEVAIAKAEELTGVKINEMFFDEINGVKFCKSLDIYDSPKKIYQEVNAFELVWKKTTKGYIAEPNKSFWDLWKKDKEAIKKQGFKVFKNNHTNFFNVFISKETVESMIND